MNNKIIGIVIAAFITITLMATVLVPILNDAQTETKTVAMNTTERFLMADFKNSDSILIEYSGENTVNVNGENFTVPSTYTTVGFSDKAIIRLGSTTMQILSANATVYSNIKSIQYESGIATLTHTDDTTETLEWQYLFYPSSVGTWGYFQDAGMTEEAYIDNNRTAYVIAWVSWNGTTNSSVYGMWEVKNGTTTNVIPAHYETTWNGEYYLDENAQIDLHYTDSEDGLTKIYTGATFTINDYEYSNQSYIIAPLEYHYRTASDNGIVSIYSVIPVIIIAAIVLSMVEVIRNRD